ncbi:hypothetical protein GCM10010123_30040 [Pilimelia anulata]|uniref:Uncharacterized protein n=1 Tax=Pilimelia anulata TaxID=53371 RepID=A0A8J3FAP6_9ACTN|nr:hypothetical protein [Pilimelia anulata]GGJ97972.1 hypothetical protein GCM10010123_30040 [Pilimelia anulata]
MALFVVGLTLAGLSAVAGMLANWIRPPAWAERSTRRVAFALAACLLAATAVGWWASGRRARPDPPRPTADPAPVDALLRTPWLGLEFRQQDRRLPIRDRGTGRADRRDVVVPIGAGPFEIRLPKPGAGRAVQLCAWVDGSIFRLAAGDRVDDVPFLRPGTGMAQTAAGSGDLVLTDAAQNYFAGRRLAPVSSEQQAILFSRITYPYWIETPPPLRPDTDISVVVYIDHNGNGLIDNDEYEYVVLDR